MSLRLALKIGYFLVMNSKRCIVLVSTGSTVFFTGRKQRNIQFKVFKYAFILNFLLVLSSTYWATIPARLTSTLINFDIETRTFDRTN